MTRDKHGINALVAAAAKHVTPIRHDLHTHPELMYAEERTSKTVRTELDAIGIEYVDGLAGGTGSSYPRVLRARRFQARAICQGVGIGCVHDLRLIQGRRMGQRLIRTRCRRNLGRIEPGDAHCSPGFPPLFPNNCAADKRKGGGR